MNSDPFDKDEFWQALGRLYDASLNNLRATEELRKIAEAHERRLDYLDVAYKALLEEIRKRGPAA